MKKMPGQVEQCVVKVVGGIFGDQPAAALLRRIGDYVGTWRRAWFRRFERLAEQGCGAYEQTSEYQPSAAPRVHPDKSLIRGRQNRAGGKRTENLSVLEYGFPDGRPSQGLL